MSVAHRWQLRSIWWLWLWLSLSLCGLRGGSLDWVNGEVVEVSEERGRAQRQRGASLAALVVAVVPLLGPGMRAVVLLVPLVQAGAIRIASKRVQGSEAACDVSALRVHGLQALGGAQQGGGGHDAGLGLERPAGCNQ